MARGDLALFEEFSDYIADGSHDLDNDSFKVMLISEQVGGTPTISVSDTTPDSGDYTEVSGGGYTAGGEAITCTWTETGGTATFQVTSGDTTWSQNGTGPTNIKTALVYNTTHAGTNDAICFIDMTTDGTTAISLQDGDITLSWNPIIFTLG